MISSQDAAIELIRRDESERYLAAFVEYESGLVLEEWQYTICDRLERLRYEKGQRILMHKPPQFGGSIIVSQRFIPWLLGQCDTLRARLACYNETHATRFSKTMRAIMGLHLFTNIFPGIELSKDSNKEDEWSTEARQAINDAQASFVALGLRSGFVGLGCDVLVIDDPYKDRAEAFSGTINEGIWDWWNEVVAPRLNPDSNVVVMFHRWKEDDLAGRLEAQGGWEVMRFPAIADGLPNDCSGLPIGEALSPRFPLDYLERVRLDRGEATFSSLWQGLPKPRSGAMFKGEWFDDKFWIDAEPLGDDVTRVLYWDLGGSDRREACYTAGVLLARTQEGLVYVVDAVYGQWRPAERDAQMLLTARRYREKYGRKGMPKIFFEAPFGMGGKEAAAAIVKAHGGFTIKPDPAVADKELRADPFCSQCEVGNIRFVKGRWKQYFIDQFTVFPNGKIKDVVDGTSGAFNTLAKMPRKLTAADHAKLQTMH